MGAAIHREETVFYAALKLSDPARQKEFLDQACADDPGLRAAVEQLLAAQAEADRFFVLGGAALDPGALPPAEAVGREPDLPPDEQLGRWIGRYKLLQKIGEGGCGIVFMAQQEEPVRRQVALKVIKLGMDTKSVIARFEEAQRAPPRSVATAQRVSSAGSPPKQSHSS